MGTLVPTLTHTHKYSYPQPMVGVTQKISADKGRSHMNFLKGGAHGEMQCP